MTDYKALLSRHESFAHCRISRGYAEKRLARNKSRTAQDILERLKNCRKGSRCFSGVCPVCARRYRLRLLAQAENILGANEPWTQLCWTPPGAAAVTYKLDVFDLECLIEKQQNILMGAFPNAIALGGIDVSLRVDSTGKFKWRVSTCVLVAQAGDQNTIEHILRVHMPDRRYRDSLLIRTTLNKLPALSYAFKHRIYFTRYDDEAPFGGRSAFKPLPRLYTYEADLFQARWPLWDRLILHNVNPGMNPHRPELRRYS